MKERIKYLRKEILKLNQEEFGKKIGISRSNVANIEVGRVNITDRVISDICKEFNVEYAWLTEGKGEMFSDVDSDIMAKIDYIMTGENDVAKRTFKAFAKLSEEDWRVIEDLIDKILKK